jgi:hypothetical protein
MIAATRSVTDYEQLRAVALGAEPARGPDLGTVRHRGLASWLKAPVRKPATQPLDMPRPPGANTGSEQQHISELTRLIAGIVVALAGEPAHG